MKITILSPRARAAVFAVLVAIFLAVLWGASELHYQGCVEAAQATTPDPDAALTRPVTLGAGDSRLSPTATHCRSRAACSQAPDGHNRSRRNDDWHGECEADEAEGHGSDEGQDEDRQRQLKARQEDDPGAGRPVEITRRSLAVGSVGCEDIATSPCGSSIGDAAAALYVTLPTPASSARSTSRRSSGPGAGSALVLPVLLGQRGEAPGAGVRSHDRRPGRAAAPRRARPSRRSSGRPRAPPRAASRSQRTRAGSPARFGFWSIALHTAPSTTA